MANQRSLVAMTSSEIEAFLEAHAGGHSVSLASHNKDGSIHLVGMFYGLLEGSVAFSAKRKSQKVANVRRDPRVTCLIETQGGAYNEIRGVMLVGRVEVVEDPERVRELGMDMTARAFEEGSRPSLEAAIYNRVALKLRVERSVSWDHGKIPVTPDLRGSSTDNR